MTENDIFLNNINRRLTDLMHSNTNDGITIRRALEQIGSKIGNLYMNVIKIRTSVIDKSYFKSKYHYKDDFKIMFRLKYCIMVYALLYDKLDRSDYIFDDAFYQSFKSMLSMCNAIKNNYKQAIGAEAFIKLHEEYLNSEILKMSSCPKVKRIIGIK